jgi:hypothetical protein
MARSQVILPAWNHCGAYMEELRWSDPTALACSSHGPLYLARKVMLATCQDEMALQCCMRCFSVREIKVKSIALAPIKAS